MEIESQFITLATQMQAFQKNGELKISGKQKRKADRFGFLPRLTQLIDFDLGRFAAAESELPPNAAQILRDFDRGVVMGALFEEDLADQALAASIVALLTAEHAETDVARGITNHQWIYLFTAIDSIEKSNEVEFDIHETRELLRRIANATDNLEAPRVDTYIGLLTAVAEMKTDPRRKFLILYLSRIAVSDAKLLKLITDPTICKAICEEGGASQLVTLIDSCRQMLPAPANAFESSVSGEIQPGNLLQHLAKIGKTVGNFKQCVNRLNKFTQTVGISDEMLDLLATRTDLEQIFKVFDTFKVDENTYLTRDAQRLAAVVIDKYKIDPTHLTFKKFCARIAEIAIDPRSMQRIVDTFTRKAKFAQGLISRKLDSDEVRERYADSGSLESDFYWLNILAILNFEGAALGSITKGLAALAAYKSETKIDDSHYQLLMDDITENLPDSLKRLYAYPENTPAKLRRLYIPLYVAAELKPTERVEYLSDAYHALARHDRKGFDD